MRGLDPEHPGSLATCQESHRALPASGARHAATAICGSAEFCHLTQPLIGYRNAVRVVREIFQDILRAAEWAFDVDDPAMLMHIAERAVERSLIRQWSKLTRQAEISSAACLPESFDELAPEHFAEDATGKKEAILGIDPGFVIRR